MAVDLDGTDAREVLLDQIAQAGQLPLLLPLLAHHAAAADAHHQQHHGVESDGCQAEPGVDRQHRWQREAVHQHRVGEAEQGKAQQAAHVLHITGGAADHLTTAGALHPARLLPQQVIKNALPQGDFHLPAGAKHEQARPQAHATHQGGQPSNDQRLLQKLGQRKAWLQFIHRALHQQRQADANDVDQHQSQGAAQQNPALRPEVASN